MKRFLSFLFILTALVSACAPAVATTAAPEASEPAATGTEEPQALSQAVLNTPLPAVAEAPIIESPAILNIQMLDEVNGWALTEEKVVRTNDGGVTWYDVTPKNLKDAGYLVNTDFLDENTAWVQFPDMNKYPNGGTLYHTTNGGLTWESFSTPFSGGYIQFVDANNGWMLSDLGVGAGSMAVSVFQTSDAGKTWNRTYTNDPNLADASDTLPLGGIKNLILPLNAKTAWIGGVVYAPGETYLFRSDDNGKTWVNINLILPQEAAGSELSVIGMVFLSPKTGLLALRVATETPKTIVYVTQDGGNTWTQSEVSFEGYGLLETPSANEMVFYVNDQFYVTKDAGVTVQEIIPDVKFGDAIMDMSFANAQTGWIVASDASGNYTLYKTTDSGSTWTVLSQ
ncbi:MAG TPA: hypothetical protein PLR93_03485 [Anaerolineales bacterium]|nr:hypothetical protein [Anaerolineales bacterium]